LQGDGDLTLAGVGLPQFLDEPVQLAGPHVQLGGHALLRLGELAGGLARSGRLDEGGDVLGPLDDPLHRTVRPGKRRVDLGPPPLLECTRLTRSGDVITLQYQGVRFPGAQNPQQ
jgi:hypothetical protein